VVPLPTHRVRLMKEFGKTIPVKSSGGGVRLPLANRLYLECEGVSAKEATSAFQSARIL